MLEWKDDGHGGRYAEVFGELFCVSGIKDPDGKRWFYSFGKFAPVKEIFNIRDMDHAIEVAVADFKNQFREMREQVCEYLENTEQLVSVIFQQL